ncbi:N-acetyltransferase [Hymenobacter oligotrophus]|uniref:N-acetyltransferase n=1 Tax=Hymenobacter oligotrophus TaxID=2319843 RepID=A0A3B7RI68_9BACT|nr:GNAT family protein [Hymenobacter oligotrophus]AYA38916.1 N-acetyltransferase [Hymenobacter oligotrophus]
MPAAPPVLSVRELEARDIEAIADYWLQAEPAYLQGMGVDLGKLPTRAAWRHMLHAQLATPLLQKQSYCLVWEADGQAVGHCNINNIKPHEEAHMHLHLWPAGARRRSLGAALVQLSVPWFFERYGLRRLYCEPYALNPAPNRTLPHVGFELVREYVTTPGSINFEQPVRLWVLTRERFAALQQAAT